MGVRLVATTVLQYAGQRYTPGEPFTARTRDDARFLKAAKRAVDEPAKRVRHHPQPVPEPVIQEPVVFSITESVASDE